MTEKTPPSSDPTTARGRPARVCVNSWAGRIEKPCVVVGETPRHYRITVAEPTALPPRGAVLEPGRTHLIPKHALRFTPSNSPQADSDPAP